jgi:hypothetical protein
MLQSERRGDRLPLQPLDEGRAGKVKMRLLKLLLVGFLILLVTPAWGQATGTAPPSPATTAPPADSAAPPSPATTPAPAAGQPAVVEEVQEVEVVEEIDGATYSVRVRDLEVGIGELKEQIRRSHTRLSLLSDTVFAGGFGGAMAEIAVINKLGGGLNVVRAVAVLDGEVQFNKQDVKGVLTSDAPLVVFDGPLSPGGHTLQMMIEVRATGYGVFSYRDNYKKLVEASHEFEVPDGDKAEIQIIVWEKGGVTTTLLQRPAIKFLDRTIQGVPSAPRGNDGVNAP